MNVRMTPIVVSSVVIATGASTAFADLIQIEWDSFDTAQGTVWQIYAAIDSGGEVDAVYGDGDNALLVETSIGGAFYQHFLGTYAAPMAALIPLYASLANDSFVTIGRLTDQDNAMMDIGIDFSDFENNGGSIWTDNGTWFATPDDAQVHEVGGRVLIGQFTTASNDGVHGIVNLQGKNADGSNWNALAVDFNTLPAPGAIVLLGIAGIASRRRRK
jgi:MYXO-CTERM domain-containing protein